MKVVFNFLKYSNSVHYFEFHFISTFIKNYLQSNKDVSFFLIHNTNEENVLANENFVFLEKKESNFFKKLFKKNDLLTNFLKEIRPNAIFHFGKTRNIKKYKNFHFINSLNNVKIDKGKRYFTFSKSIQNIIKEKSIFINPKLNFTPINLNYNDKQQIIDGFADGRLYFLCNCISLNNQEVISILKSFSAFKKWQHSHMKIMLFTYDLSLEETLKTYKYKDDVIIHQPINFDLIQKIIASSYACIDMGNELSFSFFSFLAASYQVPIITSNVETKDWLQNNLIEINTDSLHKGLVEVYKNELLMHSIKTKALEVINLNYLTSCNSEFVELLP